MAEQRDPHELIEAGKRCVEALCGTEHGIAQFVWDDGRNTTHLSYWLTLQPRRQREYTRISFTLQELIDCPNDPNTRTQLMRRIQEAIAPLL